MSEFAIKPATRQGTIPLVGMFGRSGSGKTFSSLLLMRGLVGPQGRIALVDSESGRGRLFADVVPGGYGIVEIEPPFSPSRYKEAIAAATAGADGVVVDSMSHEWGGEGGVLDMQEAELTRMAGDNWQKREACKMSAWIRPKMEHKKFIQELLRVKVPLICCLRGEEKTHFTKDRKVITDEFSSPLFDPRFIFEMTVNFETIAKEGKGGYVIPRKITHPSIETLLPKDGEQIGIRHGEALAAWCASPGGNSSLAPTAESLKAQLWKVTKAIHKGDKSALENWLLAEEIIAPEEGLGTLSAERLADIISVAQERV